MENSLTQEETSEWDEVCCRLGIADDFRSTEAVFILRYLRGQGQLRGLMEFAKRVAATKEAEKSQEKELEQWENWCLSVCHGNGIQLVNELPSEAALAIERLAATAQWPGAATDAIGGNAHKEWVLSRLTK